MKKVLIIGYFWPYRGGSGRMLGLAKYLKDFGWEPIIITAPLERVPDPETRVRFIETPYPGDVFGPFRTVFKILGFKQDKSITDQIKLRVGVSSNKSVIDKIRTFYQELFAYPDTEHRWGKFALRAAQEVIRTEKIDAILSVWPVTCHIVAHRLKEQYDIPWVADFPDPWSENHAYPYGKIRKHFDRALEQKTLLTTDVLTAAAPTYAKKEAAVNGKTAESITLGYDPEKINRPLKPLTKKFTITYTGSIYEKQDPTKIVVAIFELLKEGLIDKNEIDVRFFGQHSLVLQKKIEECGLEKVIVQNGLISQKESHQKQYESQVLLMLGWEDLEKLGGIPLKLFEYLAAKRPIIATGGSEREDLVDILTKTHSGKHGVSIPAIKGIISEYYSEFKKAGAVTYHGITTEVEKYSYLGMAERFAKILDRLVPSKN